MRLASVVFPLPDEPTRAMIWPGLISKHILSTAGLSVPGNCSLTPSNTICPLGLSRLFLPLSDSVCSSSKANILSEAASPRCIVSLSFVKRLIGENNIPIAVKKETNPPTVNAPEAAWFVPT